nr:extracellular solute-binding protein [Oceanococcus sp. HetDA_MAG_MS8]
MVSLLRVASFCLVLVLGACGDKAGSNVTTLTVYSARNEQLIGPMLEQYQQLHPELKLNLVTGSAGPLLERLRAEGNTSPADLLITVDAGNLWEAAQTGLLAELDSPTLETAIPSHLRDPNLQWVGLSVRARTLVHHPQRAPASTLSSYAALAKPEWKGRLCLRTSKKVYNQSLVAMLIAEYGEDTAEDIVRGWVANLATPPFSNDTAVLKAIAAGQCDVGIVNTYYYGRLLREDPELPLAIFWPDQDGSGVHVNVSGAGVLKASDNAQAAQKLLEWLASPQAQGDFAGMNLEYPANPAVNAVPAVAAWGEFKPNLINVNEAGRLQATAVKLMDRAGYY